MDTLDMITRQLPHLGLILLLLALAGSASAAEGPVADWRFDDGAGEFAADASGNHYDAELHGAVWVRGAFGTALQFRGSNSWVSAPLPEGLVGSDELTAEAWVYWEGGGQYPNILSAGSWNPGGFLFFVSESTCAFRMGRPGPKPWTQGVDWAECWAPLTSFTPGRWYHLAATFKRPTVTTYVDGVKAGATGWDYPVGCTGDLQIGTWDSPTACHKGLIDGVKLYRRALSAEEVRAEYDAEAGKRGPVPAGTPAYTAIPQAAAAPAVRLETDYLRLLLDARGHVLGLVDKATGKDYAAGPAPYLVSARKGGRQLVPVSCTWRAEASRAKPGAGGVLAVQFRGGTSVEIRVTPRQGYLVFEVLSASDLELDQLAFLGARVSTAARRSGMSGLAGDEKYSFCVRSLNLNTNVEVTGAPADLRALCYGEHGLVGAKAALVGCATPRLRPVLQTLIKSEGQPLSLQGGPWALSAPENRLSYLFSLPSEQNVDEWIELARRAGLGIIHICGWEQSLGHYEPRKDLYPHGLEGLKAVADKIHAAGLKVGMHVLTGCCAPNDPFVTPVPDRRLARTATYTLAAPLDASGDTVTVAEPLRDFDTIWSYASRGNVLHVDDELIMFSGYTTEPPYRFTGCQRGAFGTKAAAHAQGCAAGHLHAIYGAFYPDPDSTLVDEVAACIARVANAGRFDFLYMDGSEGMSEGWYGIGKMRTAIFRQLDHRMRIEGSEWGHHAWPFHCCVGAWDYPNWGLKQFIDAHCRENVMYRDAMLMAGHLGWWSINGPGRDHEAETPDEVEYLCCKSLANNLSVSFQGISPGRQPWNGQQDEYLPLMGQYERLRQAGYFPESVLRELREPGAEFRLRQEAAGAWKLWPTDYSAHKVATAGSAWQVTNRHGAQALRVRVQALYTGGAYDAPEAKLLADPGAAGVFSTSAAASGVTVSFARSAEQTRDGKPTGCLKVTNAGAEPRASWAVAKHLFPSEVNLGTLGTFGLWVYGDGKGEVLNLQFTDPPTYYGGAYSDHYIDIDFTGWRYFELLLKERDAARHPQYDWPYHGSYQIYRTGLMTEHVTGLNLYVCNVPRGETATCYLGAIKALPTTRTPLRNPAVTVGDRRLVFPVTLDSGQSVEYEGAGAAVVRDERRAVLRTVVPQGESPVLAAGANQVTCDWERGEREPRARVTVISEGKPLSGAAPAKGAAWLDTEYDAPHLVTAQDGVSNTWETRSRAQARLRLDLTVDHAGAETATYDSPEALTLEAFETLDGFAETPQNQFAKYVYDAKNQGVPANPGVTRKLEAAGDQVKVGKSAARLSATSTRKDDGGWCAFGRRFASPVDLSGYRALGYWVHGDGKGEALKLQLRDVKGAWQDMVATVDFSGWRYVEFEFGGAGVGLNLKEVEYLLLIYNSLPAGQSVACVVDDVRALKQAGALRNPSVTVGGKQVVFPVTLTAGERLVAEGQTWKVYGRDGNERAGGKSAAALPPLKPGPSKLALTLPPPAPAEFRVRVTAVKLYGK